jgi:hypothetical protein
MIEDIRNSGVTTLLGIAEELNERGAETPRGGGHWTATQVRRLLTD